MPAAPYLELVLFNLCKKSYVAVNANRNAGSNQNISLPTSSVTPAGIVSYPYETIVSNNWIGYRL